MDLGRVGISQMGFVTEPAESVGRAARELEELGYGALWYPESLVAKECFAAGALPAGRHRSHPSSNRHRERLGA